VTEEGGLALDIERREVLSMGPASRLVVQATRGGGQLRWTEDSAERRPLIPAIVYTWGERLRAFRAPAVEGPSNR
jgi:hypothetical protein